MEEKNGKLIVDKSYAVEEKVVVNSRLPAFIAALALTAVYVAFFAIMLSVNVGYAKTYTGSMNVFRLAAWILSGRLGLFAVGSWLISAAAMGCYFSAACGENEVISIISKIMFAVFVLSLAFPIAAIALIVG